MILELDAGNTRVKWRVIDELGKRRGGGALVSDATAGDMLEPLLAARNLTAARMVSVASPVVAQSIGFMLQRSFGIELRLVAVQAECNGLVNPYQNVSKLGADRWLAVLAARKHYGDDCLVVDCGSATTIEMLSAGRYLGGVIAPGVSLMFKALYSDTHQVKVLGERPQELDAAKDTDSAVQCGVWGSQVGLISYYRELLLQRGAGVEPRVVICGGDASQLGGLLPFKHAVHEELVLDGLAIASPIIQSVAD
ncbi:type III pantothenate kinase [Pseudoteredinibacter isoporae]|uniref:Type III pantothenate kinase n=1 Tax=Pseudoteredinibacter isoporae TaxID=570281 RepID=A0A7X0JX72_9GAMM|nr:type III pantothenate kinase [Pseudoteredinibacter isoporae]MBB6523910.1 type III pantothenate kinase [Pseudoteredinibacter isoporae]NHO89243.1 type III pantothenate kinase [Pseudoteredinibacter isoporae]NIB22072.1 type III pantothenate kinase [Pseudoteredinibacter isoporae]